MKLADAQLPIGHEFTAGGSLTLSGHLIADAFEALRPELSRRGADADSLQKALAALNWDVEMTATDDGRAHLTISTTDAFCDDRWTQSDADFLTELAKAYFKGSIRIGGEEGHGVEYAMGFGRLFVVPFEFEPYEDGGVYPDDESPESVLARHGFYEVDLGAGDFGYVRDGLPVTISSYSGNGLIADRASECQVSFDDAEQFSAVQRPTVDDAIKAALDYESYLSLMKEAGRAPSAGR